MAKPKKDRRNKLHTQRYSPENTKLKLQPWKLHATFGPLLAILDQLEQDCTVDAAKDGTAIFRDASDGKWYDSAAAISGVIDAFEIHEVRTGQPLHLDALRQLGNKLKYSMPIFQSDTDACRACIDRLKAEAGEMTAGYARDLVKDFKIKDQLEKVAAAIAQRSQPQGEQHGSQVHA